MTGLLTIIAGCFIPYGGAPQSPRWDADGEHIIYLQQRFLSGPHPVEYFDLYRAEPDLSERTRIASGLFRSIHDTHKPSPTGNALVFMQGRDLQLYDLRRRRKLRSVARFEIPWPMAVGWKRDGSAFYYTDARGIHLESVQGSSKTLLVRNDQRQPYFGLNWSPDGRLLAYCTGRNWGDGNELHVLDVTTMEHWTATARPSGLFESVTFTPDAQRIIVVLTEGHDATMYSCDVRGGDERLIWHGRNTPQLTLWHPLVWLAPGTILHAREVTGEAGAEMVALYSITRSGEEHRVILDKLGWSFEWDYHEPSGKLVMSNPERDGFIVKPLSQGVSGEGRGNGQ